MSNQSEYSLSSRRKGFWLYPDSMTHGNKCCGMFQSLKSLLAHLLKILELTSSLSRPLRTTDQTCWVICSTESLQLCPGSISSWASVSKFGLIHPLAPRTCCSLRKYFWRSLPQQQSASTSWVGLELPYKLNCLVRSSVAVLDLHLGTHIAPSTVTYSS